MVLQVVGKVVQVEAILQLVMLVLDKMVRCLVFLLLKLVVVQDDES